MLFLPKIIVSFIFMEMKRHKFVLQITLTVKQLLTYLFCFSGTDFMSIERGEGKERDCDWMLLTPIFCRGIFGVQPLSQNFYI